MKSITLKQPGELLIGGNRITPSRSLKHRNHSPDGFSWGYGGSGPSQLALAVLLELTDEQFALEHYQDFKWEFISTLSGADDHDLSVDLVEAWIESQRELGPKPEPDDFTNSQGVME